MQIDKSRMEELMKMARLRLNEDEYNFISEELGKMIDWMGELKSVSIDGEATFFSVASDEKNRYRDDDPNDPVEVNSLFSNAPSRVSNYFCIPNKKTPNSKSS